METEIEKYLRIGKQPPRKTGQRNTKPQSSDSSYKDEFQDLRNSAQTKIIVPLDDEEEEPYVRAKTELPKRESTDSSQDLDKSLVSQSDEHQSSEEDTLEVAKTVSKSRRKKKTDPKRLVTEPKQSACSDKACCLIF